MATISFFWVPNQRRMKTKNKHSLHQKNSSYSNARSNKQDAKSKLYKQWLNIKFASCIGLEKIWKNFEFMGVHGCSWVLMGSLFMCVCLSLFLQPPFLGDKKIKRRSLSDCSTLGLIVFCLFCRKFRENPKWLANPGFEMHFAKSL